VEYIMRRNPERVMKIEGAKELLPGGCGRPLQKCAVINRPTEGEEIEWNIRGYRTQQPGTRGHRLSRQSLPESRGHKKVRRSIHRTPFTRTCICDRLQSQKGKAWAPYFIPCLFATVRRRPRLCCPLCGALPLGPRCLAYVSSSPLLRKGGEPIHRLFRHALKISRVLPNSTKREGVGVSLARLRI
jgi:hypothetical protein